MHFDRFSIEKYERSLFQLNWHTSIHVGKQIDKCIRDRRYVPIFIGDLFKSDGQFYQSPNAVNNLIGDVGISRRFYTLANHVPLYFTQERVTRRVCPFSKLVSESLSDLCKIQNDANDFWTITLWKVKTTASWSIDSPSRIRLCNRTVSLQKIVLSHRVSLKAIKKILLSYNWQKECFIHKLTANGNVYLHTLTN